MSIAVCIEDFDGIGFTKENNNVNKKVHIEKGKTITWDNQGYLWFKNVCFGHMDAYPGRYFKF